MIRISACGADDVCLYLISILSVQLESPARKTTNGKN